MEDKSHETSKKLFAGPCDFVRGVTSLEQLPPMDLPEIAFAGRSNVGKSTLLNALTGRKALARVSHTPGRTQQLNFFQLGGHCYLVDMPGYGYAKISKKQRKEWDRLIFDYLRGRANLRTVFVLIDARHGIKETDKHVFELLDMAAVSYRIVLTKKDKIHENELSGIRESVIAEIKNHPAAYPEIMETSAHKTTGVEELREAVYNCAA